MTPTTTYTTRGMRSKAVAPFPNRGSRALENTFSPVSRFDPPRSYGHGELPFRILPSLLHAIPNLFLSNSLRPLHLQMQKRVVGFQPFRELYAWRCLLTVRSPLSPFAIPQILTRRQIHRRSTPKLSQPDLFIPSPRGPLRDRLVG